MIGNKFCTRFGIDVTKRCNWRCRTCFYYHKDDFNTKWDLSVDEMKRKLDTAKEQGHDHVVAIGYGEPALYPHINEMVKYASKLGMTSSIITNGACNMDKYLSLIDDGIDHFHISTHGYGDVLDDIVSVKGAFDKQSRLIRHLASEKMPWRNNVTLQHKNYKQLKDIAKYCVENGVWHFVMLNFLPHYEWHNRVKEVAVDPKELAPYVIETARYLQESGVYFTIRYFPFCHLPQDLWKYVVNARYVVYDPYEWTYSNPFDKEKFEKEPELLWNDALRIGNSVSVKGKPCSDCAVNLHCGGWNEPYAKAYGIEKTLCLVNKEDVPKESLTERGYYHYQNPINALDGTVRGVV